MKPRTLVRLVIIAGALIVASKAWSQPGFDWAMRAGSIASDQGYGIKTDASGNSYITGKFAGSNVDFDPGAGSALLSSFGTDDIFVLKLDPDGNFLWVKQMGGTGIDNPSAMAIDPAGNIYITGNFAAAGDFDPGAGTFTLTPNNAPGFTDLFLVSLDASGTFRWATSIGDSLHDRGEGIAADASNVYLTGTFMGTVDFDPGAGSTTLTAGGTDAFVSAFDTNGTYKWAKQLGGSGFDRGNAVYADGTGNVYTTGTFAGVADFDPGAGVFNLTGPGGGVQDAFVSKLDNNGNFVWAKGIQGSGWTEGFAIHHASSTGVLHIGGYFNTTVDFDPGASSLPLTQAGDSDAFILTLDTSGNLVWAKAFGGALLDIVYSMDTDNSGSIYSTGSFTGTADFDPGSGVSNLVSAGSSETFISKLDASGNYVWASRVGGSNADVGRAIDVDLNQNVVVTGVFRTTSDFNPGPAFFNLTSSSSSEDVFVLRLNPANVPTITSFAPTSGPAGTVVTITGTNFDPTPANNQVYFGAGKATVTSATFTQLVVTVPFGATYQPIRVSVNGGSGFSNKYFLVTFPGGGAITTCSYDAPVFFGTGTFAYSLAVADLDGDGKVDAGVPNSNENEVEVFRNTSISGTINAGTFATGQHFAVGTNPSYLAFGDLDGDGKPDMVVTSYANQLLSVFRNTSTSGSISFAPRVDFATNVGPSQVNIRDLDGDGRAEIVISNGNSSGVSIWRNIGDKGSITSASFAPKFDVPIGGNAILAVEDMDLDGKPDIISGPFISSIIRIFKNISTPGALSASSFAAGVDFTVGTFPEFIAVGDLDSDTRPDIITSSWPDAKVSVLKNTSAVGTINTGSFAPKVEFATGSEPRGVAIADFDGDGNPDIALANQINNQVWLYKNVTTPGVINTGSFAAPVGYTAGGNLRGVMGSDVDNDGRPELLVTNWGSPTLSVLHNTMLPVTTGTVPASGFVGTSVTIQGSNFSTVPANNVVLFNGTPATVLSATSTSLSVKVPAGATSGPVTVSVCGQAASGAPNFDVTTFSLNRCNAISLNGTTDYVSVADNPSLQSTSITVETLVNFSVAPGPLVAFVAKPYGGTFADSYALWYSGGLLNGGFTSGPSLSAPWTPVPGQWYHLALTYDNSTQREVLYLNGLAVASGTTITPVFDSHPLRIGVDIEFGVNNFFFNGRIDETRIWNFARTEAEIQSTINNGLTGSESGLVAYYTFSETGAGSGQTIVNSAVSTGAVLNGVTAGTAATPTFVEPCSACLPASERNALVALHSATGGTSWTNQTNWLGSDVSNWYGVTTNGCHVAGIDLSNNNLVGTLPAAIGDLTELTELRLSLNQLGGTLPAEITDLVNLEWLVIDNNDIGGPLPATIGNMISLREIDTQGNAFTGTLPASLANCVNMESIRLEGNQHTGTIPIYLSTWPNLYSINLAFNQFSGSIPSQLGTISTLTFLSLAGNSLDGSIPVSLGSLSNLVLMDLSRNQLSGSIPLEFGNLNALQSLQLWTNQLDGYIPSELGNLFNLQSLNLSDNLLYGNLPPELGNLSSLVSLNLATNRFASSIPPEFGNIGPLRELILSNNFLFGPIPFSIGNLANLRTLYLDHNDLDGALPNAMTGLDELTRLNLSNNAFTFIPAGMASLSFIEIDLSSNLFSSMPVFSSPSITLLAVENNDLDFGDLEPNMGVSGYSYSPQHDLPPGGTISFNVGDVLTIPFSTPGTGNSYQWYRGFAPLAGATSATLTKPGMLASDYGFYYITITSSVVPGLVLKSIPYVVITNPCGPGGPDGSLDVGFDPQNTSPTNAPAVELQSDGKIIVATGGMMIGSVNHQGIIRFNPDGTIDNAFNEILTSSFNSNNVLVQPDDKILYADVSYDAYVFRANSDGTPDVAFNNNSPAYYSGYVTGLGLQSDGKIIVAHNFYMSTGVVDRLNADGTPDPSFTGPTDLEAPVIRVQPDGKILLGGSFPGGIMRINSDGSVDPSFEMNGANEYVTDILIQPDGKILVVGYFTTFNAFPAYRIVRLNADGTNDQTFTAVGITDDLEGGTVPYRLGLQADGKIIVGGTFETFNGGSRPTILRLATDGSLDCSFDSGQGAGGTINDLVVQTNGSVVVSGDFMFFDTVLRNSLARVNNTNATITITLQPSDVIVCEGQTAQFNTDATGTTNITYQWQFSPNGPPAFVDISDGANYTGTNTKNLVVSTVGGFGVGRYRCRVNGDNAAQKITNDEGLFVNAVPGAPGVTPGAACGSAAVMLSASGGTNGQYRWYTVAAAGTPLAGETNSTYTTPVITVTTTYYVSLLVSGCEGVRSSVDASILTPPVDPGVTGNTACALTPVTLSASGAVNGQYRWYSLPTGGTAITGEVNDTYLTPSLPATTIFYVSINNGACESNRVAVTATMIPLPATPGVTPGLGCGPSAVVVLQATGGASGEYRWYDVPTGGTAFTGEVNSNFSTPTLTVSTTYYVSVNNGTCESLRASVQAQIRSCTPTISSTSVTTQVGGTAEVNILPLVTTVSDPLDPSTIHVVVQPTSGAVATVIGGVLSINYSGVAFAGSDELTIEACDMAGHCGQQVITIQVAGDITVYNAVSANGDGLNEVFYLQYIDLLPSTQKNRVTIFDRWGNAVFEKENYNNAERAFRGLSNDGSKLPSGTYFYKLDFFGAQPVRTGFLSLRN